MTFDNIKNLLRDRIGLHADSIGVSSIERAINHRMSDTKIASSSEYYERIINDQGEFGELVEEIVVPETWFFRNRSPFDALRKCVAEMEIPSRVGSDKEPIKILSLPCATGEEPYSIAMALMEDGLKEGDFLVDGVDISSRALVKAKRALYGKHSFREPDIDIQEKYFKKGKLGFSLLSNVKSHVSFKKANIVSDDLISTSGSYDVIFCRNLLIYFPRETQTFVLDKLHSMLKIGGVLFVGHAETAQINQEYFSRINLPNAFAYRKGSLVDGSGHTVNVENKPAHGERVGRLKDIYDQLVEVTRKDLVLSKKLNKPMIISKGNPVGSTGYSVRSVWDKVEKLINSGQYDEAILSCEKFLEDFPENADGYYYLGLISNLRGSVGGAESLLKKAIYLSPHHTKALSLSVLLAENKGDYESADYYRRREKKSREKS